MHSTEDVLRTLPGLSLALSSLVSIRSLSGDAVGQGFCDMLRSMKSSVLSLRMDFINNYQEEEATMYHRLDREDYPTYHPIRLLAPLSRSLEVLRLHNCHTSLPKTQTGSGEDVSKTLMAPMQFVLPDETGPRLISPGSIFQDRPPKETEIFTGVAQAGLRHWRATYWVNDSRNW